MQSKTVDGKTTTFVYDGANIVAEITDDNITTYFRGARLISTNVGTTKLYYHHNPHGNVTKLTNADGQIVESYTYDAFGNQITSTGNNSFRYCGEYYDADTGLIYLRARWYDTTIGRFISEDPIKHGGNWYVYCSNNPLNFIDPLGLFDWNTRLSYNQTYNDDVKVLQNELAWLGYLDMSGGGWGYFGSKTQDAVNRYKADRGLGNTGKDWGVVGLQTWTSLGLIHRTEKDISAGVIITTIDCKQYKDISTPINNALNRDSSEFAGNARDYKWFRATVGDTGSWNVKRNAATWEGTIGTTFPGYSQQMLLYGMLVYVEDVGNITYGYLGKAAKFSDAELIAGSSLNHLKNHGVSNWKNEFSDHDAIRIGIDWYKGR